MALMGRFGMAEVADFKRDFWGPCINMLPLLPLDAYENIKWRWLHDVAKINIIFLLYEQLIQIYLPKTPTLS